MLPTIDFSYAEVLKKAKERPKGYLQDVLRVSTVEGGIVKIPWNEYFRLSQKYTRKLLGDRVHSILNPIAIWIDGKFGTTLAGCSACSKRRAVLNRIHISILKLFGVKIY